MISNCGNSNNVFNPSVKEVTVQTEQIEFK